MASARKKAFGQGLECPSCGGAGGVRVDRKYVFTALVRCGSCGLLFRTPTTSFEDSRSFYQKRYSQGFTTCIPANAELKRLIETRFSGEKSYRPYIDVLEALGVEKGQRVFDFGCSWGYGSWQLKHHGFEVDSFEISDARAKFAREKLGLRVVETMDAIEGVYDVFFASHVLEHVPSVQATIALALRSLRPGGLFVAFTPNGSSAYRSRSPSSWHQLWGNIHPQLLDDIYYGKQFQEFTTAMDSAPYKLNELTSWSGARSHSICLDLSGYELLVVAAK